MRERRLRRPVALVAAATVVIIVLAGALVWWYRDGRLKHAETATTPISETVAGQQHEVHDTFRTDPSLSQAASGQRYITFGDPAAARPTVAGGLLTNTTDAPVRSASYSIVNLGHQVNEVGAVVEFTGGRGGQGGNVTLISWQHIGTGRASVTSGAHLAYTLTGWDYDIVQDGAVVPIARGSYPRLQTGKRYTVDLRVTGDSAAFLLPDGRTLRVTDSRIGELAGNFACWESYQNNPTVDAKGGFASIWAD
jgi:hypothetical protein